MSESPTQPPENVFRPCFYDPEHELQVYSFNQGGQGHYEQTHGVRCLSCSYESISINEWNAANCWREIDHLKEELALQKKKTEAYRKTAATFHLSTRLEDKEPPKIAYDETDEFSERILKGEVNRE